MDRTIVVAGYGPGISTAVARKFGGEGFKVALVARRAEAVQEGAKALADGGITARGFSCDLADPAAVRSLIGEVRRSLGPVTVVHWNAYSRAAGDLLGCSIDEVRQVFDLSVGGLIVAVQEALPDLRAQKGAAAVLVTGGGFAFYDAQVDAMAVGWNTMGTALAKAAQHKLVGLLSQKLAPDGIYVGEVVVLGVVKGTAFDTGQGNLEPSAIADRFWQLYQARSEMVAQFR